MTSDNHGLLVLRDPLVADMTAGAVRLTELAAEQRLNGDCEQAALYDGAARYVDETVTAMSRDEHVTLETLAVMRAVWEFSQGYGSMPRLRARKVLAMTGRYGDAFRTLKAEGALREVGARVWLSL